MGVTEEIECKIAKDRTVIIKAVSPQISLKEPVFAVNWFNTKSKNLYSLYNRLAYRSVSKVGGKAVFKGSVIEKIQGKEEDHREMLLIVKYPSAYSFKNLIDSLYFKLVSILRIKAVRDFNFGFTRVHLSNYKQTDNKTKIYAVHHLKKTISEDELSKIIEIASKYNVYLFYSGTISALLYAVTNDEKRKQVPCTLNGLLLWYTDKKENITSLFLDDAYTKTSHKNEKTYLAFLKRTL